MIVFSWLYVVIIFVYLIQRELPIFFLQKRVGLGGSLFSLIKFRTLSIDETRSLQGRRFWWGNFLRATSLDELPQLWNVLKGDMSLVGPRPLPDYYLPLYSREQLRRHEVRPGVTGLAQVNGRNRLSWKEKFRFDVYYVENVSLFLDLQIIFKTIVLLLSLKKDVSLNEERFTGNE
ncbi:sugar transferase [Fulvivirgaceae bacterium PWU20]|uniref:Sugar transferase n=2 Tax=Chryseosolibacter indicus TaxID=2782351 RepID=A0ABS5VZ87_9BACT|nr:sugar transferase [Chryseosolibacter indicus]